MQSRFYAEQANVNGSPISHVDVVDASRTALLVINDGSTVISLNVNDAYALASRLCQLLGRSVNV